MPATCLVATISREPCPYGNQARDFLWAVNPQESRAALQLRHLDGKTEFV